MRRILVMNSKGGCGKTTIASNLASYYATQGIPVALIDHDPQSSSLAWLDRRGPDLPEIYGSSAQVARGARVTQSFHRRVPAGTERIIMDTPASLKPMDLNDLVRGAAAIIVPTTQSTIDRHVTETFVGVLRKVTRAVNPDLPIALVANRARTKTRAFRALEQEVEQLGLNLTACLRETQNYQLATDQGLGIHECPLPGISKDRGQWRSLLDWLEYDVFGASRTDGIRAEPVFSPSDENRRALYR